MNNKNILDLEIATMSTYSFFETSFSGSGDGKTLKITCHVRKTEMNPTTDWMNDAFSIVETGKNQVSFDSEWIIERDASFDEVRVKMEKAFRETVNEYSSDVLLLDSNEAVSKHPSFLRIEQFHDVMIVKTLKDLRLVSNGENVLKKGNILNMGLQNFKKASAWVRLMKDMPKEYMDVFSTAKITEDEQKRLGVFGEAYEKKEKEREAEKEKLEAEGRKGVIDFLLKDQESVESEKKKFEADAQKALETSKKQVVLAKEVPKYTVVKLPEKERKSYSMTGSLMQAYKDMGGKFITKVDGVLLDLSELDLGDTMIFPDLKGREIKVTLIEVKRIKIVASKGKMPEMQRQKRSTIEGYVAECGGRIVSYGIVPYEGEDTVYFG